MEIVKKLIKFNFTQNANKPEYIVVHDTGNRDKGADAMVHFKYFNGGDRQASAHFFVDDKTIMQLIEIKDKAWHCGDGMNKKGIGNSNSIGIEICINSDSNYKITLEKTAELVAMLQIQHNILENKIVRHYDASGKNCPQTMNNKGDWTEWINFKMQIKEKYNQMISYQNNNSVKNSTEQKVQPKSEGDKTSTQNIKRIPKMTDSHETLSQPWQIESMNFLLSNGFIQSYHDSNENVTIKLFAWMINNYKYKEKEISPVEFLTKHNYINTKTHDPDEIITWEKLGLMFATKNEEKTEDSVKYMLDKGYVTADKEEDQNVKISFLGAVIRNAIENKLSI